MSPTEMQTSPAISLLALPASAKPGWAVPYYVKGLALGVPIYFVAIHLWTWLLFVPSSLAKTGYDFRQEYAAAYMVRTGKAHELYDYEQQTKIQDQFISRTGMALPYVSPAYEALLLSPLSLLPFRAAYFTFLCINLLAIGITYALLRPWTVHLHAVFRWLPIAILLGFLPIAAALIEGQDSVILMALLAGAFVLLTKERCLAAGLVTGIAFFKFPIVLPIAVLFLIWRHWQFLAGFTISAALVMGASVALTGISQTRLYVESLLEIAGLKPPTTGLAIYPVNWHMMANLHGLAFGLAAGHVSDLLLHLMTMLLSAGVLAWTAFRGLRVINDSHLLLLAIPCSVLVGHHTYIHDLSVLFLPLVVLLNGFLPTEAGGTAMQRLIGRSAALMFVAPVIESYSPGRFYFVGFAVLALLAACASAFSMNRAATYKAAVTPACISG